MGDAHEVQRDEQRRRRRDGPETTPAEPRDPPDHLYAHEADGGQRHLHAEIGEALRELRAETSCPELTAEPARLVDAGGVVEEVEVGERDDVALHALDLDDVGDAARAVTQPRDVHDQVHRVGHQKVGDARVEPLAGHGAVHGQAAEHALGRVRVDRAHRAGVALAGGLQKNCNHDCQQLRRQGGRDGESLFLHRQDRCER